jgi:hypothetical protein
MARQAEQNLRAASSQYAPPFCSGRTPQQYRQILNCALARRSSTTVRLMHGTKHSESQCLILYLRGTDHQLSAANRDVHKPFISTFRRPPFTRPRAAFGTAHRWTIETVQRTNECAERACRMRKPWLLSVSSHRDFSGTFVGTRGIHVDNYDSSSTTEASSAIRTH